MCEYRLTVEFLGDSTSPQVTNGRLSLPQAVKFARKDLDVVKDYLKKAGIYLLMTDEVFFPDTTSLYVGECVDVFTRLKNHEKTAAEWPYCIAIVDVKSELEKNDVLYLESVLIREYTDMGYKLENKQKRDIQGTVLLDRFLHEMEYHLYALNGPQCARTARKCELSYAIKRNQTVRNEAPHENIISVKIPKEKSETPLLTGLEFFPKRVMRALQNANITTLSELTTLTQREFRALPGIGKETATYVELEFVKRRLEFQREQITPNYILAPNQQKMISTWLSTTTEDRVCARMICQEVLHLSRKPSKSVSIEICALIRQHGDWVQHPNKNGLVRFEKYGKQLGYIRKDQRNDMYLST